MGNDQQTKSLVVVATYTEPLLELPSYEASKWCRNPLAHVFVNLPSMWEDIPELDLTKLTTGSHSLHARLHQTLAIRFGLRMVDMFGALNFPNDSGFRKRAAALHAMKKAVAENKVNDLFALTALPLMATHENPDVLELVNGIGDEFVGKGSVEIPVVRYKGDLTVVGETLCGSLDNLMESTCGSIPGYNSARSFFVASLTKDIDWISAKPLETAYGMSLLCRLMQDVMFYLPQLSLSIKPTDFRRGRLFKSDNVWTDDMVGIDKVEKNVLFVEDEPQNTHNPTKKERKKRRREEKRPTRCVICSSGRRITSWCSLSDEVIFRVSR